MDHTTQSDLPVFRASRNGPHALTGFSPNRKSASSRPVPHAKNQRLKPFRQVGDGAHTELEGFALLPGMKDEGGI